ncbi:hypothetical protein C7410_10820 [Paraburkholderia silvatlantica]|uniref:Uncharacterized protein n=1 Tax=Paraburkholderia silvatlantica TaxID=321895 RepID=A0A2V4TCB3_9BURK|nr:hypothetical protein [Paraburkholderia silvatlantica]PYE23125.1 hypothetical protein C7410_10820 [Paraburkholderia silvatlantica]
MPPTGSVLFAKDDRVAIDAAVASEPFKQKGLAETVMTEVNVMIVAPGLDALREGQEA